MGKEGDLWDDSALINAFDHAISTYKIMHGNKNKDKDSTAEAERVIGGSIGENGTNVELENVETRRDAYEKSNIPATEAPDSGEASYISKLKENHHADSQVGQVYLESTSSQNIQNDHNSYPYTQGVDDYNQLVGQYYELEKKRQKILEKLNEYGGWNYQYAAAASGSGVPYSNSQDYSMSTYQVSDPHVVCSCCPCFSQSLLVPCTSVSGCSQGGTCVGKPCNNQTVAVGPEMLFPCEDGNICKIAMGAAEKAMSTIQTTISGDSKINQEKEGDNSEPDQFSGSETDLTAVLNAWYSAGFYTGKYLVEQSIANRRQR